MAPATVRVDLVSRPRTSAYSKSSWRPVSWSRVVDVDDRTLVGDRVEPAVRVGVGPGRDGGVAAVERGLVIEEAVDEETGAGVPRASEGLGDLGGGEIGPSPASNPPGQRGESAYSVVKDRSSNRSMPQ